MKIVFENEHFIAAFKPAGWLSVPSRMGAKDARTVLGIELQKTKGAIFPVHRLDEEVSGLILYAKNSQAHKASQSWLEDKQLQKTYQALTENNFANDFPEQFLPEKLIHFSKLTAGQSFSWSCRIQRGKRRSFESPHGDQALTEAVYLGQKANFQMWELQPITGRSHQLRLELFRHGYPILGDKLYASAADWGQVGIALRSIKLDFQNCQFVEKFDLPKIISLEKNDLIFI
jgi:tRNA pseudouridine32 synthase / 23S rRNA pseudouridine746 synthase